MEKKALGLTKTTIGKKLAVAATGLVLLLFLIGHMAGNLKAFFGVDSAGVPEIDVYAGFLRTVGAPLIPAGGLLWAARAVLLFCLVVHVVLVLQIATRSRAARPIPYARYQYKVSSWSARSMMVSGLLVLAFVVFHILHFTTGTIRLGEFEQGQVYHNLYHSFRSPLPAAVYLLAMVVVGAHVLHGTWSFFQTWGIDSPDRNRTLRGLAWIAAVGLAVGFAAVPLLFLSGIMPAPR